MKKKILKISFFAYEISEFQIPQNLKKHEIKTETNQTGHCCVN